MKKMLKQNSNVQNVGTSSNPTVISLFAGCGGSTLGYKMAGFKEILALDWDNACEKTYLANFTAPFLNRDITKTSSAEIMKIANIKRGELDVLDGSPPCQGFSTSGDRRITDLRNSLFKDYIRILNDLQPKVFVMENVPGQIIGKMKGVFKEIVRELKKTNYNVLVKKLNSANYGVPQARQRLFFIGVRKDLNKMPVFPETRSEIVTVANAFKDLPPTQTILPRKIPKSVKTLLPFMRLGDSARNYNAKRSLFNWIRCNWNGPSSTIPATPSMLHPFENRFLTIEEVKRLCSFPDNFYLYGSPNAQWKQLGNAVMPLQMKAIAETIKNKILY